MLLSNGPSLLGPTSFGLSAISHMVGASDESSIPSDTIGKSAGLCPTALELQCAALEDRKWNNKVNLSTPISYVNTPQFGTITMAMTPGREIQLSARLSF